MHSANSGFAAGTSDAHVCGALVVAQNVVVEMSIATPGVSAMETPVVVVICRWTSELATVPWLMDIAVAISELVESAAVPPVTVVAPWVVEIVEVPWFATATVPWLVESVVPWLIATVVPKFDVGRDCGIALSGSTAPQTAKTNGSQRCDGIGFDGGSSVTAPRRRHWCSFGDSD